MKGRERTSRARLAPLAALTALAAVCAAPAAVQAGSETSGIHAKALQGKFTAPVHVASPPGQPNLLFVVEQRGVVRAMRNGKKLKRPFLDIRKRVRSGGEQGLLSIAFAPNYGQSRRFYAYYTNTNCRSGNCDIEVAEFRRKKGSRVRAKAKSHRRVITIRHRQAANHNGGTVMFGPDGMLWLATGDGGGGNDTFDNARKKGNLLGKLLRIDPLRRNKSKPGYRVPQNNPFVGKRGRDEIWSLGLRNPFRFSFDEERGAIAIGDVGQSKWEEVNFVAIEDAKGANFGWPQYEGEEQVDPDRPGPGTRIEPMHVYRNPTSGAASVIGGVVLRDPRFAGVPDADPADGIYLFGDAYSGPLQRFEPDLATNTAQDLQTLPNADLVSPGGFGTDSKQRVYVADRGAGKVYRLDPP